MGKWTTRKGSGRFLVVQYPMNEFQMQEKIIATDLSLLLCSILILASVSPCIFDRTCN
jgi:hypothetical protein